MSRYMESYRRPNLAGPGDARPTALQIIRDEGLTGALTSKIFLITAHIIGTVRNLEKGHKVVDEILTEQKDGKITLVQMDLSSFASVREGAAEILSISEGRLNVLIANAGIMAIPFALTTDGYESQFATNHLGHFLLFQLLKDALLACSTPTNPSRFISVSSKGHARASIRLGDYNFENKTGLGGYDEWEAYGQSKTANIWMANSIHRNYSPSILSLSLHPGGIITPLSAHFSLEVMKAFDTPINRVYFKSPAQGAATQVFCAVSQEARSWGGKWISNCAVQPKQGGRESEGIVVGNDDGFAKWAFDKEGEERLWRESFEMVGLPIVNE